LYQHGSLKGRMINVFSPVSIVLWTDFQREEVLGSLVQLAPMGRESHEKNIINFELFSRAVGAESGAMRERTAEELIEISGKILKLIEKMKERHFKHISKMREVASTGDESFVEVYSQNFLKGDCYYIQRVCDSIIGDLSHYREDVGRGRMGSGETSLTAKQYSDLVKKFESVKNEIYRTWPVVRPALGEVSHKV